MYRNGRMEALPDLPYPISAASLTVYKGFVSLCGGYRLGSQISKDCLQLNIFNTFASWKKIVRLPIEMYAHSSVQVLDKMWFFSDYNIYVVTQTGRATVIKWPRAYGTVPKYSCAQSNGVITVVIPDRSRHVYINKVASSPGSWAILATLPTGLHRRSCLMMGSLFYVTGGWNGATYSKETYEIYIENFGSVERVGDLLTARYSHSMGVIEGEPAVFGGDGGKCLDDTEILDTNTQKWRAGSVKMAMPSGDIASVSFPVN